MDFRGFPAYPSNYTNFSDDHALEGGMWSGRSLVEDHRRSEILLELEKKRIREEILAEEAARRRLYEAEIRREYMMRGMQSGGGGFPSSSSFLLGHPDNHHYYRSQPLQYGQSFEPADRRIAMPFQEDFGGGGSGHQPAGELVGPFQRGPKIKEIITSVPKVGDVFIGLGNPHIPSVSGAKRKQSSSPAAGGSADQISSSSKKKTNEWSCAICEVSATSERGLHDHLAGKKHQAKVAGMTADHTSQSEKLPLIKNSPESVQLDLHDEDKKPEGESSGQKFKFWCRMCKTGASTKQEMNMHKKGVKHLKNQLNRAQKSQGKAGGRRGRF